jgi:hypothetical protein
VVTPQQYLGPEATQSRAPGTDKGRKRSAVGRGPTADGHQQDMMPTGTLPGPGTHQPVRVGQEDNLEPQGGGVSRGAPLVVATPRINLGQLPLVSTQLTPRVCDGTGQNLAGASDGEELRPSINRLGARHRVVPSR